LRVHRALPSIFQPATLTTSTPTNNTHTPDRSQERREERLGLMMTTLRSLCTEVGEDAEASLAEVHPTLACMW